MVTGYSLYSFLGQEFQIPYWSQVAKLLWMRHCIQLVKIFHSVMQIKLLL